MAETNTRQASRAPVTLKIKFKSETLDQFIERYSVDISHGGIFIRTKDPLAVGTSLKFEFQLKDATPLITGEGTVVWTREPDAKRAGVSPGMGVRFDKLPSESQKVLDAVLAQKGGKLSSEVEPIEEDDVDDAAGDFVDSPTRVAPAGLVDSLVSAKDYDDGDLTPLPKPMPFHGDVDDFSDEAFNESTKVASIDTILAQAKGSAETDESAYDEDAVFASTSGPIAIPTDKPEKAAAPAQDYEDPFADLNEDEESVSTSADSKRADRPAASVAPTATASSNIITSTADAAPDPVQSTVEDARVDEFDDAEDDEPEDSNDSDSNDSDSNDGDQDDEADEDDEDDEDDRELDDDDDGTDNDDDDVKAKSEPSQTAARAAVVESAGDDEQGSSLPWIAVAAVILLIGGVGGFWLLNKSDKDKQVAPAAKSAVPAVSDPSRLPDTAAKDPSKKPEIAEAPAALTKPVTITTVPEGARLTVEGTELQAISPATFDLEAGKTHTVHVQHDAFLSQSIEVQADDSEVPPVTLAAKPKLLRITSQPPGAIVLVNGQRLRGRAPIDLPVTTRMAAMPSVRVQLRLPGYQALDARVPMNEGFEPTETQLISAFTAQLKQFTPRPQDKKATGADSGTGDKATDKTEPAKTEPAKTEPAKTEPAKTEPAKTEPAKTEPAKKPDTKADSKTPGSSEPTPDWMK